MDKNATLKLKLVDVRGKNLGERVDVILRHLHLSERRIERGQDASEVIKIDKLYGAPDGIYKIEIDPPSYLSVEQFISLNASGDTEVEIKFPIDLKKVRRVSFPKYSILLDQLRKILEKSQIIINSGKKSGEDLYKALDEIPKAGLLNIATKANATPLSNGENVFSYVKELIEVQGDRIFAFVSPELHREVEISDSDDLFESADGSLHHPPAEYENIYKLVDSFKTNDRYGNLQITFFKKENDYLVDIDIDDAGGLEHIFQVLRNSITGRPTHPYNIHEILFAYQKLDAGYNFVI